ENPFVRWPPGRLRCAPGRGANGAKATQDDGARAGQAQRARRLTEMWRWVMGTLLAVGSLPACDGCSNGAPGSATSADAGVGGRLTPEQAHQVLARVGTRSITLGD